MKSSLQKLLVALCMAILVSLSCGLYENFGWLTDKEAAEEEELLAYEKFLLESEPGSVYATPTPRPTRTKESIGVFGEVESWVEIKPGTCAWVKLMESQMYPGGFQGSDLYYDRLDSGYGMITNYSHSNQTQIFITRHFFDVSDVYYPGETVRLGVTFSWENDGDSSNATLVSAGGVTMLTIGDVKITARNDSIAVRTDPQGSLTDAVNWVVPEGSVGDRMTMTQHISTGSYGTNVRWYYEYYCD